MCYPFIPKNSTRKDLTSSQEGQPYSHGPAVRYGGNSVPRPGSWGEYWFGARSHIGEEGMDQGQGDRWEPQENLWLQPHHFIDGETEARGEEVT